MDLRCFKALPVRCKSFSLRSQAGSNPTLSAIQSQLQIKSAARFPQNARNMPVFRNISSSNRTAENGLPVGKGAPVPPFLRRAHAQSGFETSCRRMQCDQKPMKRRSPGLYSFVHKAVFTAIAKYGHYSRISAQSERKFSAVQMFTLHSASQRSACDDQ